MRRLAGLLVSPRLPWGLALLAALLALPALSLGIFSDDWLHRCVMLGGAPFVPGDHPLLDLFVFIKPDEPHARAWAEFGLAPWWTDPDLAIALLRPLSALTHVLDYRLFGENYGLHHLHGMLWLALCVLAAARLYRRVMPGAVAGLAALLFAVEDAHAFPVAWLANRNELITLVFGVFALEAHVRWRRQGGGVWPPVSILLLALGLLAGEAALGAMAYVIAWQLTRSEGSWPRRLAAILPGAALVLGWRLVYDALGYGARGSGIYVDPAHQPLAWLGAVAERLPILMASGWTQFSADPWLALPREGQLLASLAGLGICGALLVFFLPLLRSDEDARFWALGSLLSLLPVSAALPMERLLGWWGLGAFGLLACQARAMGWLGASPPPPEAGGGRRFVLGVLLILHLPWAAFLTPLKVAGAPLLWRLFDHVETQLPDEDGVEAQTLVLVRSQDLLTADIVLMRAGEGGRLPRRVAVLGSVLSPMEIESVDARTLSIRVEEGWLLQTFDRLFRGPSRSFTPGERVDLPDFTAHVVDTTPAGLARTVEFTFKCPMDDPSLRWVTVGPGGLIPFDVPAPGERIRLDRLGLAEVQASLEARDGVQ